jgi:hypothetical protein
LLAATYLLDLFPLTNGFRRVVGFVERKGVKQVEPVERVNAGHSKGKLCPGRIGCVVFRDVKAARPDELR